MQLKLNRMDTFLISFISLVIYSLTDAHIFLIMILDSIYFCFLCFVILGEDYGIPMPLLAKYKIGKVLTKGSFVLVKRCNEK